MALQGEPVLVLAGDLRVSLAQVLGRLTHRVVSVLRLEPQIGEPPPEGRVPGRQVPHPTIEILRDRVRCAAHTLDASATKTSPSPALIARAAALIAESPEEHRRLKVTAATETGRPARRAAIRATFRLSSPAWFAQPR